MELTPIKGHENELPAHARNYQGGFVKLNDGRFVLVAGNDDAAKILLATQTNISVLATFKPQSGALHYTYDGQTRYFSLYRDKKVVELKVEEETLTYLDLTPIHWSDSWPFSTDAFKIACSTSLFALSLRLRECLERCL